MANSVVWIDLKARVAAAAISLNGTVLPIRWPNKSFSPPTGVTAPWLMVEIAGGSGAPIELGGLVWQDEGQSLVHVLVPTNSGVDGVMDLVDQIIAMFRSPPYDPVIYTEVSADPGGPGSDDGAYWRTSVTAYWRVQTIVQRS